MAATSMNRFATSQHLPAGINNMSIGEILVAVVFVTLAMLFWFWVFRKLSNVRNRAPKGWRNWRRWI
jgi:flagellar biogenesis protein FliO